MERKRICLFLAFSILIGSHLSAQRYERTDERPAVLIDFNYSLGFPLGDLADRFGGHNALGNTTHYLFPSGWSIGVNGRYFFGRTVTEEGLLSNVLTSQDFIIGNNQAPAEIKTRQRGWVIGLTTAKLFDIDPGEGRSGLRLEGGAGLMWHRIRLQDDRNSVIQLFDPYFKGYDRLTGGPCGILDVSYQYMGARRMLNFRLGLNAIFSSTSSWRGFNYDTGLPDTMRRGDHMIQFYAAFILPIYGTVDASQIYY